MDQSNHERQEEELQVLQAIYMSEFEDLRSNQQIEAGSPPIVRLKLTPLQSIIRQDVHANVDLVVKYTTRYPTDPPILRLENAKGLSNDQIGNLKRDLDNQAKNLIGEVMVLQLAQSVQAFLHKHNVPTFSFHEQMLKNMQRERENQEMEREKRLAKDKAQAKEFDDDVSKKVQVALQEREEALKEKGKRRQQVEENRADSLESENGVTLGSSPPVNGRRRKNTENSESADEFDRPTERRRSISCSKIKQKVQVMNFTSKLGEKVIHCGNCLGHHFQGACTRAGLDLDTGEVITACEWILRSKQGKRKSSVTFSGNSSLNEIEKQVHSMEQELSYLSSKLQHPNLIHYHSMSIEEKNETLYIRILMDNIDGYSISDCINPPGIPINVVKDYAKQLVHVINHLHSKSVVHRDLKPSNLFICKWNTVKVCGYAVLRRLSDLHNLLEEESSEQDEFADYRKLVKPGKKGDIFNLGLVTLSLLQGKMATGYPVELPAGLPDDLQDFLLRCLNIDEKERWTASQLIKHQFLIIDTPSRSNVIIPGADSANGAAEGNKEIEEENLLRTLVELNITSKTRLMTDFEILESLGQGGFGDVIKVRKKLDGLLYAIKRINLNPKSAQLRKRIIREVKLLSRLNHENVVRYYSSWIEAEEISKDDVTNSDYRSRTDSLQRKRATNENNPKNKNENTEDSLLKYNNFEEPIMVDGANDGAISWDVEDNDESSDSESLSSDDDDDDDDDLRSINTLGSNRNPHTSMFVQKKADTTESSDGVVFAMDDSMFLEVGGLSDSDEESENEQVASVETSEATSSEAVFAQYLYIQMEYCEKSTLRNAIDEGLHTSSNRMWRLFREIVEGLSHVHSQGIIHRDLKPFNIFMDSRDHVKIGDFGLATSHFTGPVDHSFVALSLTSDGRASNDSSNRMTGKVGTALYVAPEIDNFGERVKITQKVDLYSLGVIFFEMCYKPLSTGMERVKTLGLLRTEKIILPDDFEEKPRPVERKILYWLLNHDAEQRPTASELLESGLVPPKLEDRHFDELLTLTLKQPSSTRYKRLTAALFSQSSDPVTEQIYDMHLEKRQEGMLLAANAHEHVEHVLRSLLTRHGAIQLDIPLLMPRTSIFEQQDWITNMMDPEGIILSLPFDSRVSLARYVSRNNIRNIKRYSVSKVYRDTKISRTHPKEIKECSFDIISDSANSMVPDAEVLYAVDEVVKYFPCLRQRKFYVRINHTNLLKAILMQANVNEDQLNKLVSMLQSSKGEKDCMQEIKNYLTSEGIPEHNIIKLTSLLDFEGPVTKVREALQSVRKSRGIAGSLAKQALNDLTALCKSAQMFGVQMPIQVHANLAYNLNVFSGIVFQIVAEHRRKRKHGSVDILAAGGRYDHLVEAFKRPGEQKHIPHAIGVSIAFEKIVNAVLLETQENETVSSELSNCDVLVGVMGESILPEEKLGVVRDLWSQGIKAMLSSYDAQQDGTPEILQDICKEAGINHLVLLKASEIDVRIRSREKERFTEVKVSRGNLCDYLLQKMSGKSETKEVEATMQKVSSLQQLQPSETQLMNLTFILQDKSVKRRVESQVQSILSNVILHSFLKTPVEVVVVDLPPIVMKNLFAHLEIDAEEDAFEASVSDIIDKQKLKKSALYIHRICSTLREIKKDRNVVLLYGYKEDFYRIFV